MSEERYSVSIDIDNILDGLPPSPCMPSIFRIDEYIKSGTENLHVPKLVSIGPIYHGEDHLQKMERCKFRYLKLLLQRLKESSVEKYVKAIKSLEEQAWQCYADPIDFSSDDFVKMLLLDGFFIVEFTRKFRFHELRERDDRIFKYDGFRNYLVRDMMLLENQIPFFVLDRLFNMTNIENLHDNDLISLIQHSFGKIYPGSHVVIQDAPIVRCPHHLLDLMYKTWCPSFAKITSTGRPSTKLHMNSATELRNAGIYFKNNTSAHTILDIEFAQGVLRIPSFPIFDCTESVLRNLILYEKLTKAEPEYVGDYAFFFQCLINSSKDVETLRLQGIVLNFLGDEDDVVNQMFKRLGKNVTIPQSSIFRYGEIFYKVNRHCKKPMNRRMANLRHNYFNSPWSFVSFIAAVVLLTLTIVQTDFSILSYAKGGP